MILSIGVLGSTKGTDLQAVIGAIEAKELNARISAVVSNKKDAYILERAGKHNIDAVFIDPKGKEREEFDRQVSKELEKNRVNLILAIGYNQINPIFL